MNGPMNDRYERRFTDPNTWPSNAAGHHAVERTRVRVNELAWSIEGDNLVEEIAQVLRKSAPRMRRGDPGE